MGFIIAIDFDNTVVKMAYPKVGEEVPHAVRVLKKIIEKGHKIMLWTMRGNQLGNNTLKDATDWYAKHGIPLWGVNENPEQTATGWTNSHKQHHNLLIDDVALGIPLVVGEQFVDWVKVEEMLISYGIL